MYKPTVISCAGGPGIDLCPGEVAGQRTEHRETLPSEGLI